MKVWDRIVCPSDKRVRSIRLRVREGIIYRGEYAPRSAGIGDY